MSRLRAAQLLVFALASSAGVHTALLPTHAEQTPMVGTLFALSALSLAVVALCVDRAPGAVSLAAAAVLLATLLAVYAATRMLVLPPFTHAEPIDALGAITKLIEAAGLVLALRFLHTSAGRARSCPPVQEGAGP